MARTRSATQQLAGLFEASPAPIYALDDQRRIVYANAACLAWLGLNAEQLLGLTCQYHNGTGGAGVADAAAALAPPPEAFLGDRRTGAVVFRDAEGGLAHRAAEFLPLGPAADCRGVLVLVGTTDEPQLAERRATEHATSEELHRQLRRLSVELRAPYRLERLAGESAAIRRVREQVQLASGSRANVTILGPPGSGREQVARTIHSGLDPEKSGALLPLSCPVLDAELLQTTVLAFLRRCADAELAGLPTLLLLDVDQLAVEGQAELLAFFRVPTFRARAIVTARQPLTKLADNVQFSRELACTLSTLVIELPALADRREDIPLLAQQLVEEHNTRGGLQLSGFTPEALDAIAVLPFPGNVAELATIVQAACKTASGPAINLADLPPQVRLAHHATAHPPRDDDAIVLDEHLAAIERELVERAMQRARGNKARAARLLGIPRARLLRKLVQLGLEETPLVWRPSEENAH